MVLVTKEKYLEQRNALMTEIENLIEEGKIEESNAKMEEVKNLDNKWEEIKLANANLNALKDNNKVLDLNNKNVNIEGGTKTVDNIIDNKVVDENKVYENAWAKFMQGNRLEGEELEIFNKVNKEFNNNNAYTHTTTGTPTLIPETVVKGIWARAEEMYPFLADVKKYNVRGTLVINKHTAIDAGDAAWYDESPPTADEKNAFGQLTLTGCELSKAITVTWKLRSMATEEFIPYIKNELGKRVGVAMGTAVLKGQGQQGQLGAEPLGVETALLAESGTPQVVTYDFDDATTAVPLTYAKVTEAISKVHSSYLNGCAFYANNATIWTQLANITDENGRPIFIPDTTAGGVGRMLGFVVKADAGVTANNIVFGNPGEGYVFNTNEPMSLATEEHVKARTVDYVAYAIVDGAPLDTKAFALIRELPAT